MVKALLNGFAIRRTIHQAEVSNCSMDIYHAIHDLQAEKARVEQAIASLENVQGSPSVFSSASSTVAKRRGRRSTTVSR
jgi:hypothetical protein